MPDIRFVLCDVAVALNLATPGMLTLTATVCGLPTIAIPASKADKEIASVYCFPVARLAVSAVTVKVAVCPLEITAEAGSTVNHLSAPNTDVAFTVMLLLQVPTTPTVKVCERAELVKVDGKVKAGSDTVCNVQGGWTVK